MSPKSYTTLPDGTTGMKVHSSHWDDLEKLNPEEVCKRTGATLDPDYGYQIRFLNQDVIVDTKNRSLRKTTNNNAEEIDDPLLALVLLVYLQNAVESDPKNILTAPKELKEGHFFTGVHALDVEHVIEKFGHTPEDFAVSAEALGGVRESHADMSYRFTALPRIPLYYLLWEGDEDFPPNITVCFDRTIEQHLAADAIWALVKRVSRALVKGQAL